MEKSTAEIQKLLKDAKEISGISAEFLMTFLLRFEDDREKQLIYLLCSNLFRLEHRFEIQLLNLKVNALCNQPDPDTFSSITRAVASQETEIDISTDVGIDVGVVEVIRDYLNENEMNSGENCEVDKILNV
ncbi:hypothetical protein [Aliikangiella coralliicola]|uniref:Uncharacterized protein n=1 Tax=Aliikangiella coralliicola TaxID=2592383 RepID=A0A545U790_9GAMM|nr:hypothetical protein [Aliikangiella coralliicola]TQV85314.1 hypothetical protein FLL46_19295 [Aliikangiella coralliicola]